MATDEAPNTSEWSYRGTPDRPKLILAPMVRVNSLAFRTACAENGCDMLYSEEIVARSLVESRRVENTALGTVDFLTDSSGGGNNRCVFRTRPGERVVLQLGTACAAEALRAAQTAAADVRAIDLNMGCPVKFSLQGGMGSALLTEPEKVRDILTTLRRNLPESLPVTAKIRLLDDPHETLALAKLIESCGVSALAVHARRRHDRPRHWAQYDQFRELKRSLPSSLPVVLNGDVFTPSDISRALELTEADGLMLARGALWNPSIFRLSQPGGQMLPQADVVRRYVELCEETECPLGNAKYTSMVMLEGSGKTAPFRLFQRSKTFDDLRAAAAACASCPHFTQPGGTFVPAVLEPPADIPDAPSLAINSWRPVPAFWKPPANAEKAGPIKRNKAAKARAAPEHVAAVSTPSQTEISPEDAAEGAGGDEVDASKTNEGAAATSVAQPQAGANEISRSCGKRTIDQVS